MFKQLSGCGFLSTFPVTLHVAYMPDIFSVTKVKVVQYEYAVDVVAVQSCCLNQLDI